MTRRALNRSLAALPLALAGCAGEPASAPGERPLAPHRGRLSQSRPAARSRAAISATGRASSCAASTDRDEVALPAGHVLPEAEALDGVVNRRSDGDRLTWLGHASFLLRLDGRTS